MFILLYLASRGPYASILTVYQQRDWGPGMVKCVGPTRCLMQPTATLLPCLSDLMWDFWVCASQWTRDFIYVTWRWLSTEGEMKKTLHDARQMRQTDTTYWARAPADNYLPGRDCHYLDTDQGNNRRDYAIASESCRWPKTTITVHCFIIYTLDYFENFNHVTS